MRVRALSSSGDFTYGKGVQNYLVGIPAVQQVIKTRIMSFYGDCFFATQDGIDWWNLLGERDQTPLVLALTTLLINTVNVTQVVNVSVNLDHISRNLTVQYSVRTIFSQQIISGTTIVNPSGYIQTESGQNIQTQGGQGITIE